MTFCRWYPLEAAAAHVPSGPGVLQLRVAAGLVDYPRGKSAMVHYEAGADMAEVAVGLARRFDGAGLLCRHSEDLSPAEARDVGAACGKLVERFTVRFGCPPRMPT